MDPNHSELRGPAAYYGNHIGSYTGSRYPVILLTSWSIRSSFCLSQNARSVHDEVSEQDDVSQSSCVLFSRRCLICIWKSGRRVHPLSIFPNALAISGISVARRARSQVSGMANPRAIRPIKSLSSSRHPSWQAYVYYTVLAGVECAARHFSPQCG